MSGHALDNLVKSKQLEVLTHGVYVRPDTHLTWQGVVCALQHILKTDLIVGGLDALDMQGLSHYLPLGKKKTINLYGTSPLPKWTNALLPDVTFVRHSVSDLLGRGVEHKPDPLEKFTVPFSWKEGVWPLKISTPERAFLELIEGMPKSISFEHADQLMQGLTTLVPDRMQKLLEVCQSKKARRLFLWLAARYNHAWFGKMKPEKIDLGTGKRQVAKDGKLDNKYLITIPESMWTETANSTGKSSF